MKLLIVTQTVDVTDPVLGFFVRWIEEFAKRTESIEVICLYSGTYQLPANVRVHSLGKERGRASRLLYIWRFIRLAWELRHRYDAVFVHMNQEYVLLAGWLWKSLGKRIFLWRNHYAGSWLTDVASFFCRKVFCTSKHSYTARYKRTVLMPVGVDIERFHPDTCIVRVPRSILWLARIAPSKRLEMLIDALAELSKQGIDYTATIVGSPLRPDESYYTGILSSIDERGLADRVILMPAMLNAETPDLYRAHHVFVNTSPSGMLDKTIFEAAACGCVVLTASRDVSAFSSASNYFDTSGSLVLRLVDLLSHGPAQNVPTWVMNHSLTRLSDRLIDILNG